MQLHGVLVAFLLLRNAHASVDESSVKQVFEHLDANNDGSLSLAEFQTLVTRLGGEGGKTSPHVSTEILNAVASLAAASATELRKVVPESFQSMSDERMGSQHQGRSKVRSTKAGATQGPQFMAPIPVLPKLETNLWSSADVQHKQEEDGLLPDRMNASHLQQPATHLPPAVTAAAAVEEMAVVSDHSLSGMGGDKCDTYWFKLHNDKDSDIQLKAVRCKSGAKVDFYVLKGETEYGISQECIGALSKRFRFSSGAKEQKQIICACEGKGHGQWTLEKINDGDQQKMGWFKKMPVVPGKKRQGC